MLLPEIPSSGYSRRGRRAWSTIPCRRHSGGRAWKTPTPRVPHSPDPPEATPAPFPHPKSSPGPAQAASPSARSQISKGKRGRTGNLGCPGAVLSLLGHIPPLTPPRFSPFPPIPGNSRARPSGNQSRTGRSEGPSVGSFSLPSPRLGRVSHREHPRPGGSFALGGGGGATIPIHGPRMNYSLLERGSSAELLSRIWVWRPTEQKQTEPGREPNIPGGIQALFPGKEQGRSPRGPGGESPAGRAGWARLFQQNLFCCPTVREINIA